MINQYKTYLRSRAFIVLSSKIFAYSEIVLFILRNSYLLKAWDKITFPRKPNLPVYSSLGATHCFKESLINKLIHTRTQII